MRVIRDYNTNSKIAPEKKPDSRKAYGVMVEYSKALNSHLGTNFYHIGSIVTIGRLHLTP